MLMKRLMPTRPGGFPKENVDPEKKKTPEWMIQYCQAFLGTYMALPSDTIGYNSRNRYDEIRKYAMAKQPFSKYEGIMQPEADTVDLGFHKFVTSQEIVPIIPKPRNVVISLIQKAHAGYDITLNPIDPQAAIDIERQANELRAKVAIRGALKRAGHIQLAQAAPVMKEPGEPDDLEGAEVAILGMRHKVAMKGELIIAHVLNYNRYPKILESIAADLCDYGVAVVRDNESANAIPIRKVDMRNFVCSTFESEDGSDITGAGELVWMPIAQVINDSNGYITEEHLKEIWDLADGQGKQDLFAMPANSTWERTSLFGKVQVLDLEFISTDTEVREERKNRYGSLIWAKGDFDAKSNDRVTVHRKAVQNLYCCKWIVGTDQVYAYGRQRNVKMDPRNEACVRLSYHFAFSHIHNMVAYSCTENMIPFADAIQMRKIKLDHFFNTALPKGFQINLSALHNMAIDAAGQKKLSPMDVMNLAMTRNIVLYEGESLIDKDGKALPPPLQETVATIGSELSEYWNDIQMNLDMLNGTLGLNDTTDGSSPNPKRSNPGTAAALNGTKNALSKLFNAERNMTLSLVEGVLVRAQNMFKNGKGKAFATALGSATVAFMTAAPAIDAHRFGFIIEDRPTEEEVLQFEDILMKSVEGGFLYPDDIAMVRTYRNMKERNAFLVYTVRKNREQAAEQARQDQMQNGQIQQESAKAAEVAKQQTETVIAELKAKLIVLEKNLEYRNDRANGLDMHEKARIDATGRTNASYVQAKGRDEANIRDNVTKLVEQGLDHQVPNIDIPATLNTNVEPLTSAENTHVPGHEDIAEQEFSFLGKPLPGIDLEDPNMEPPQGGEPQGLEGMGDMMGGANEAMPDEAGEASMPMGQPQMEPQAEAGGLSEEAVAGLLGGGGGY